MAAFWVLFDGDMGRQHGKILFRRYNVISHPI